MALQAYHRMMAGGVTAASRNRSTIIRDVNQMKCCELLDDFDSRLIEWSKNRLKIRQGYDYGFGYGAYRDLLAEEDWTRFMEREIAIMKRKSILLRIQARVNNNKIYRRIFNIKTPRLHDERIPIFIDKNDEIPTINSPLPYPRTLSPTEEAIAECSPKGLFIHGLPRTGKRFLLDIYQNERNSKGYISCRRESFSSFMDSVHGEIANSIRSRQSRDQFNDHGSDDEDDVLLFDPIPNISKRIASETPLLILEDFNIVRYTDAILCRRLFLSLFGFGIALIASSNSPPKNLYENGFKRKEFSPFIDMIKLQTESIRLECSFGKEEVAS